jgi:hypothetical protein
MPYKYFMSIELLTSSEQEELSIVKLRDFLITELRWKMIEYPEKTQALDGVLAVKKNSQPTGDLITVQVKTGSSYKTKIEASSDFIINLRDKDKFDKWKNIWRTVPGVMLFIFADFRNGYSKAPVFYWADLKNENSYIGQTPKLFIKHTQLMDKTFPSAYKKLKGYTPAYKYFTNTPVINKYDSLLNISSLSHNLSIKKKASIYYNKWKKGPIHDRTNPAIGEILINRVGWKNICRRGRAKERIIQSLQLLPVAKEMIKSINQSTLLRTKDLPEVNVHDNTLTIERFYYVRALVKFKHRSETIVYVIFKQITVENYSNRKLISKKTWLFNVYEGCRGVKKDATSLLLLERNQIKK